MTYFGLNASTGQLDEVELDTEIRDVVEAAAFMLELDRAEVIAAGLALFAAEWRSDPAIQALVALRARRREEPPS